ncbi:MAG: cupin domain-containing protein [Terracidiphilus sp.]
MQFSGIRNPARRSFLRVAPAAAAAGLALADAKLFAAPAQGQEKWPGEAAKFQLFTAAAIGQDIAATQTRPGNIDLVNDKNLPFTIVLTSEKDKSAPEFEWHQSRDHIFQILDGSTEYEVGGTPKGGRYIAPGEWRGKDVEGATKLTLNKGDRLVIPRGTPHRRSTRESVTFTLISPEGAMKP